MEQKVALENWKTPNRKHSIQFVSIIYMCISYIYLKMFSLYLYVYSSLVSFLSFLPMSDWLPTCPFRRTKCDRPKTLLSSSLFGTLVMPRRNRLRIQQVTDQRLQKCRRRLNRNVFFSQIWPVWKKTMQYYIACAFLVWEVLVLLELCTLFLFAKCSGSSSLFILHHNQVQQTPWWSLRGWSASRTKSNVPL